MESEGVWNQPSNTTTISSNPAAEDLLRNSSSSLGKGSASGRVWPAHQGQNSDPCWSTSSDQQSGSTSGKWGSISSVVSDNSWVTGSHQDNNSASGWGTPTSEPCPMAGTEAWSQQRASATPETGCMWGPRDNATGAYAVQDAESSTKIWGCQELGWNAPANGSSPLNLEQPSGWDGGVITSKHETSSHVSGATLEASSLAQIVNQGVDINGTVGPNGKDYTTNCQLAREEMITRAINCHDGWGQTPVRQDTVWDVGSGEMPVVAPAAMIVKPLSAAIVELSAKSTLASSNGTAIWEASKENVHVPSVSCHIPIGVSNSGNSNVVGCGENSQPLWGFSRSIGDRGLPPPRQVVKVGDSWNVQVDAQAMSVGGVWIGSQEVSSKGRMGPEEISDANAENSVLFGNPTLGMSNACLGSQSTGVLESIENVQSAIGTTWPGSLLIGNKSVSETAMGHHWKSSLLANSFLSSLSSSSPTVPVASLKPSVASDPWSNPEVQAFMPRTSSWTDPAKASIWDPMSSPKSSSCWDDGVNWSADSQRLSIWGAAINGSMSAEEKKADLGSFSLAVGDVSKEVPADDGAAERAEGVDHAIVYKTSSNNGKSTLSKSTDSLAGAQAFPSEMQVGGAVRPSLAITANLNFPPPVMSSLQLAANLQQQVKTQQFSHAQQLIQQSQMLQHLQQNASNIPPPPKPGSAPPPHPTLVVAIQQLLQLQQLLQRLQIQQATVLQNKIPRPLPVGCDPLAITIAKIRQQIGALQMQIHTHRRQLSLAGQFDSLSSQDLAHEFSAALQVRGEPANVGGGMWKPLSVPDSSSIGLSPSHVNEGIQLPMMVSGTVSTEWSGWPGVVARTPLYNGVMSAVENGGRDVGSFESGTSQSAELGVAGSNPANLDIEEFVPGKPWQGPNIRSADDDPFVTPGSVSQSAFNINAFDVLGNQVPTISPVASTGWMPTEARHVAPGRWPRGGVDQDQFGPVGLRGAAQRAPPGLVMPGAPLQQPSSGGSGTVKSAMKMSNSIIIKNLPAQIDSAITKMLCQQHGSVQLFNQNSPARLALVTFVRLEDALKAQHALHGYVIANTLLAADFVPDAEVGKLVQHFGGDTSASPSNLWSPGHGSHPSTWNGANASVGTPSNSLWNGNAFSNSVGGH